MTNKNKPAYRIVENVNNKKFFIERLKSDVWFFFYKLEYWAIMTDFDDNIQYFPTFEDANAELERIINPNPIKYKQKVHRIVYEDEVNS